MTIIRTYPDAERSVLGTCIYSKDACHRALQNLNDFHFTEPAHIAIFGAIRGLYSQSQDVNLKAIMMQLDKDGDYDKMKNALAMLRAFVDGENLESNIALIKESHVKSRVGGLVRQLQQNLDNLTIEQILKVCYDHVNESRERITWESREVLDDFEDGLTVEQWLERQQERFQKGERTWGIPTKITPIDEYLRGLNPTYYIIISGAPGSGKTTLTMQIINNVMLQGYKVGFMSLELTRQQVIHKINSLAGNVPFSKIVEGNFNGIDYQKIYSRLQILRQQNNLFVEELPINNLASLISRFRYLVDVKKVDVICIDYIGLIKALDMKLPSATERIGLISQTIADLLKEYRIPGLILCQLNRGNKYDVPDMANLRDSGALEQNAHQILMLHRPEEEEENKVISSGNKRVNIYIRKNRFQDLGTIFCHFDGTVFTPMSEYHRTTVNMIEQVRNEFEC